MARKLELMEPERAALSEMADAVKKLSQVGAALRESNLSERAILILLADITKMSKSDIQKVLNALPRLEKEFLKEK